MKSRGNNEANKIHRFYSMQQKDTSFSFMDAYP